MVCKNSQTKGWLLVKQQCLVFYLYMGYNLMCGVEEWFKATSDAAAAAVMSNVTIYLRFTANEGMELIFR